jgi:hypothetical protein
MPAPILAAKLYVPPAQPAAVTRSRLIEHLDEGLHRRLTSAPQADPRLRRRRLRQDDDPRRMGYR